MSLSWAQRKQRLQELLKSQGDEEEDGLTLDKLLHGQNVIGKTSRTSEIDSIRFQDRDLVVMGTLEYGSFGVIDVVTCRLDSRVYVRKSIEKRFALRTREQCSPQFERDILLQALKTNTCWAPHLLCAFHTETHLSLVMDYAEGGTLWDVLESSPLEGRISEDDLRWWTPQIVSAIHWCHSQGFAHRDIKPHNFVLTPTSHILLIDFGSAAPLLPPTKDGVQLVPKRFCIVPCGTCDYISPEILKAHEQALVALEMEDEGGHAVQTDDDDVYGLETDWWSMGAMLYEMAYGIAPFFAEDIKRTYFKIMEHKRNLRFNDHIQISEEYQDFLRGLLTDAEFRLGRRNVMQITDHPFFDGIAWSTLSTQNAPSGLHLPQFAYSEPQPQAEISRQDTEEFSQPFAFSAFFQSSVAASSSPGISFLYKSSSPNTHNSGFSESTSVSSFIGFSWGPSTDAFSTTFDESTSSRPLSNSTSSNIKTPRSFRAPSSWLTPGPQSVPQRQSSHLAPPSVSPSPYTTPGPHTFSTPIRGKTLVTPYHTSTLPRASTVRRTLPRRTVSDREAMRQLVDCVGMSARKKVLESGRKPRILPNFGTGIGARDRSNSTASGRCSTVRKELRFLPPSKSKGDVPPFPSLQHMSSASSLHSQSQKQKASSDKKDPGMSGSLGSSSSSNFRRNLNSHSTFYVNRGSTDRWDVDSELDDLDMSMDTDTTSEAPPSPSPSPRPGSAMSMVSMMSRRSATPTATATFSQLIGGNTPSSFSSRLLTPHSYTFSRTETSIRNRSDSNSNGQPPIISNVTVPSRGRSSSRSMLMVKETETETDAEAKAKAKAVAGRGVVSEDPDRLVLADQIPKNPRLASRAATRSSIKEVGSSLAMKELSESRNLTSFDDSTFDELEVKHASIMEDISLLETRLGRFSKLMGKGK